MTLVDCIQHISIMSAPPKASRQSLPCDRIKVCLLGGFLAEEPAGEPRAPSLQHGVAAIYLVTTNKCWMGGASKEFRAKPDPNAINGESGREAS